MSRTVKKLVSEGDANGLIGIAADERLGKRERRAAIQALGEMQSRAAVQHLIPLLRSEGVALFTAEALGLIGDGRAAPYLAPLMASPNRVDRTYGELALRRLYVADPDGVRAALDEALE